MQQTLLVVHKPTEMRDGSYKDDMSLDWNRNGKLDTVDFLVTEMLGKSLRKRSNRNRKIRTPVICCVTSNMAFANDGTSIDELNGAKLIKFIKS